MRRKVSKARHRISIAASVIHAETTTPFPVKEEAQAVFNLQIGSDRSGGTLPQIKNIDN